MAQNEKKDGKCTESSLAQKTSSHVEEVITRGREADAGVENYHVGGSPKHAVTINGESASEFDSARVLDRVTYDQSSGAKRNVTVESASNDVAPATLSADAAIQKENERTEDDKTVVKLGIVGNSSDGCVTVRLSHAPNRALYLQIHPSDCQTVLELKQHVADGITKFMGRDHYCCVEDQDLFLFGKELENSKRLDEKGVKAPHVIYLRNATVNDGVVFPLQVNAKKPQIVRFQGWVELQDNVGNKYSIGCNVEVHVEFCATARDVTVSYSVEWEIGEPHGGSKEIDAIVVETVNVEAIIRSGCTPWDTSGPIPNPNLKRTKLKAATIKTTACYRGSLGYNGIGVSASKKFEATSTKVPEGKVVRDRSYDVLPNCTIDRKVCNRSDTNNRYVTSQRGGKNGQGVNRSLGVASPGMKSNFQDYCSQIFNPPSTEGNGQALSLDVSIHFGFSIRYKKGKKGLRFGGGPMTEFVASNVVGSGTAMLDDWPSTYTKQKPGKSKNQKSKKKVQSLRQKTSKQKSNKNRRRGKTK